MRPDNNVAIVANLSQRDAIAHGGGGERRERNLEYCSRLVN